MSTDLSLSPPSLVDGTRTSLVDLVAARLGLSTRTLSAPAGLRLARRTAAAALLLLLVSHLQILVFVDPDLWHEMALAREMLSLGRMPLADSLAYTPTIYPVVHHEWGMGVVLYAVTSLAGGPGLLALKYALTFGTIGWIVAAARRRGASWETIFTLAPALILAGSIGFTTVRAQVFTLFFLAWLLYEMSRLCGDGDPAAGRSSAAAMPSVSWPRLLLWAGVLVAWLNLHAGFVVGLGVFALFTAERLVRRRPCGRLIFAGLAAAALVAVNPYGLSYYEYLVHGLTMPRPLVTEWQPLWRTEQTIFRVYLISLLVLIYAAAKVGPRRMPGLVVVVVTAYLAVRHTRHVSIYFVVWMALVPAYIEQTGLSRLIRGLWLSKRRWIAGASAFMCGIAGVQVAMSKPWSLPLPTSIALERMGLPVYPVGPVEYLRDYDFHGNLYLPFVPGGYCAYRLSPNVKVSLDGRYEVAYRPGVLEENVAFYDAEADWEAVLTKYPTDLILVHHSAKVMPRLAARRDWRRVYFDGAYALFARPGLALPTRELPEPPTSLAFP